MPPGRVAMSVALLSLVGAVAIPPSAGATSAANLGRKAGRVLIISLPSTRWADVDARRTPTLLRLLDESAVADLSTRAAMGPARLGDGYATLSAGTRSDSERTSDGAALEAHERFGDTTASVEFERRTGRSVTKGLVHLGLTALVDTNRALRFDAKMGSLGDALDRVHFTRAVIANADGVEVDSPPPIPVYERSAVTALMKSDGTVPAGAVGPQILQPNNAAPFGMRLNAAAVERAFETAWKPRSVVLVEGSDLARADAYRAFATSAQRRLQWEDALRETDHLVARLLKHVDAKRDAVVIVGPAHPASASALTIAAVRAPGLQPGFLQSGTTRRAGYASLVDIAPTILSLIGAPRPDSMEGRALVRVGQHGSAADRRTFLVDGNRASLYRDDLVDPMTLAYVVLVVVLAGASVSLGRFAVARPWLRFGALASLGFLLATWLAGPLRLGDHGGTVVSWLFATAVSVGLAAVCTVNGRRAPLDPLMLALGSLALLLVADAYAGTHFELDTVFGYSATVGIRFAGVSNLAFAQMSIAVIALAVLFVWRLERRRGVVLAVALLAVAFVALTPPLFGQNLGATLAAVPAFGVLGWLIAGRTVRARTALALGAALAGVGLLVGYLDLLRPGGERTHVGRLFEKVGHEGLPGFATVIQRKASENLDTLSETHWLVVIAVVVALVASGWWLSTRPLRRATVAVPSLRAGGIAVLVVAALGYALNDSGVAIPGMMLGVVAATVVYLTATVGDGIRDAVDAGGAHPALARPTGSA